MSPSLTHITVTDKLSVMAFEARLSFIILPPFSSFSLFPPPTLISSTGFSISSRFSFSVSHKLIGSETPSVGFQIRSFLLRQGDF
ncbi:hypothetical protein L1987_21170 [Smallanthus sonchifolius]|uniref:Uncharacterized protein n=1 Tax=Smallanthus sonchifolius TaxID=185202 RepID=A0ACB9IUD7_9ASTR|nr:hypothetical protein L1987_21170 [Smallanthus sonchifolius]